MSGYSVGLLKGAFRKSVYASTALISLLGSGAYAADSGSNSSVIETVTVTASRKVEDLQKSSLAISVYNGEALVQANVTQASDLSTIAPGVDISMGGTYAQVYMRGVGNLGQTSFADQAVATNLDQIYLARPSAFNGVFYDLDRVEVLKGPQGTLYGRNASGGAINLITNSPNFDGVSGYVDVEGGNYALIDADGALNVPISNTLAVRGAFQVVKHDGYETDGTDDQDQQAGRFKVLYEPNNDLSITLSADYAHLGGKGPGASVVPPITGNPWLAASSPQVNALIQNSFFGSFAGLALLGPDSHQNLATWGVSADVEWNLGFAHFTFLPAYRGENLDFKTYQVGFPLTDRENEHQTSLEARLSNDEGPLSWVVGAFYFNEDQSSFAYDDIGFIVEGSTTVPQLTDTSWAGFGQATYKITDRLRLIGGARYTHEEKNLINGLDSGTSFGSTVTYPLTGQLVYGHIDWKAGAEYDLTEKSMLYFTASTGFKAGGFYLAPAPNTYRPEELTSYELGVKNRFFSDTLQLNLEAFWWDYLNHQETFNGSPGPNNTQVYQTINAGAATIRGLDTSVEYLFTPSDTFFADVEYNNAYYNQFGYDVVTLPFNFNNLKTGCLVGPSHTGAYGDAVESINCNGQQVVKAPTWSGTVGLRHVFDWGTAGILEVDGKVRFSSAYWGAVDFEPNERQGSFTMSSVDLTYTPENAAWSFSAYVHNIENSAVASSSFQAPFVPGLIFGALLPPRTYGARVSYKF